MSSLYASPCLLLLDVSFSQLPVPSFLHATIFYLVGLLLVAVSGVPVYEVLDMKEQCGTLGHLELG